MLLLGAALNALIQTTDLVQRMDQTVLDWFTRFRTSALTDAAKVVALLTTFTAVMVLRVATVVVLVVYGRFRHLVVFLVTLAVTDWVVVRGEGVRPGGLRRVLPAADDLAGRQQSVRQDLLDQP